MPNQSPPRPPPPEGHAEELRRAFGDAPHVAGWQMRILRAGEPSQQVFLIASGWACRERQLANDRRVILDIYLPGDVIGLDHLFTERSQDSIVTLTALSYFTLEREALERLLQNRTDLALHVMKRLAEERWRLERVAARGALLPAVMRAAAGLLHLHERRGAARTAGGGRLKVELPLTQAYLADYLGLNEVHLGRALRALSHSGAIQVLKAAVIVHAPGQLRSIVGANIDLV
jgi:CRP-like cAMP-binding protein